jgi:hypothetical protein
MGCGCKGGQRNVAGSKHVVTKPARAVSSGSHSRRLPASVIKQQAVRQNQLEARTATLEKRKKLREVRKKIIAQRLGEK